MGVSTPAAPPPRFPAFQPPEEAVSPKRAGCMKWGLIGCAGASVLLIVGLLYLVNNAKEMMDWAFERMADQVIAACTPEVTPTDKAEFRSRLKTFAQSARAGKVKSDDVRAWQSTVMGPLADGKITPEEIRSLSSWLAARTPPPAPKQ